MINEQHFFEQLRQTKFITKLTQKQVDGFKCTIDTFDQLYPMENIKKLAYILATFWHETAFRMEAIEEYGKGRGLRYGKKVKLNGKPYTDTNNIFYGRGFIQTTWYDNYLAMGKRVGVDLIKHPEKLLEMELSAKVSIIGIMEGLYTGKGLDRYFSETVTDPLNARKCVNGLDKAKEIEKYYNKFLKCLQRYPND